MRQFKITSITIVAVDCNKHDQKESYVVQRTAETCLAQCFVFIEVQFHQFCMFSGVTMFPVEQ